MAVRLLKWIHPRTRAMRFFKTIDPVSDEIQVGGLDLPSNTLKIDGQAVTNFTKAAMDAALAGSGGGASFMASFLPALASSSAIDTRAFFVANSAGTIARASFLPFANYDGDASNYHMIKVTNLTSALDVTQASGLNAVGALTKNTEHQFSLTANTSVSVGDVLAFDIAITGTPASVVPDGVVVIHLA